MKRACFFLLIACTAMAAGERIARGTILVADRKLDDSSFRRTVVLIADHSDDGTLGLVLNRRSETPVSEVLEKW